MTPRNLYYHALLLLHTALLVVVLVSLWVSNRRSTLQTRRRLADFDRRLDSFQKNLDGFASSSARSRSSSSDVGQSASSPSSSAPSDSWVSVPPRVLGSGRSGSWIYSDVLYGDGATRRHYIRTNATPREIKAYVRSLSFEASAHSWVNLSAPVLEAESP